MKIALIGRGLIGQAFLGYLKAAEPAIEIAGALVRDKARHAQAGFPLFGTLDELLAGRPDWVVECAGQPALAAYAVPVLRAGCNLLAISSGALANEATLAGIRSAVQESGVQLAIPAGALPAVDALAAAKHVGLTEVRIREPPNRRRG